jgi:hypothetical protein
VHFISLSPCLLVPLSFHPPLHAIMFAGSCRSGPGDRSRALRRERKVRTPQDSRLANGQAGQPDGRVQQRTDSPPTLRLIEHRTFQMFD